MASIHDQITEEITHNPVVLFMKGTPDFPQCGFSGQVVQILEYLGAPFKVVNVLEDPQLRQGIRKFANWPTIPQHYWNGKFSGDCHIGRERVRSAWSVRERY